MDKKNTEDIIAFLKSHPLFRGFTVKQIETLSHYTQEKSYQPGEIFIHENTYCDQFYIIKTGQVEVFKSESSGLNHSLSRLGSNQVIGELMLLENAPRSASIRAIEPTVVYAFSINDIKRLTEEQHNYEIISKKLKELSEMVVEVPFYSQLIQNVAKGLNQRMRSANDTVVETLKRELAQSKVRLAMGYFIVSIISLIVFYMFVLKTLEEFNYVPSQSGIISIPVIIGFTCIVLYTIMISGYKPEFYGLTLHHWKQALFESLIVTVVLLFFTVILKILLIHYIPGFEKQAIFSGSFYEILTSWKIIFLLFYILLVPLQELTARGLMQGSFQEFLQGPNRKLIAIILSNLLFTGSHFHLPLITTIIVFGTGLIWGWLYSRHHTLLGVTVSHIIVGVWALFVVGVT